LVHQESTEQAQLQNHSIHRVLRFIAAHDCHFHFDELHQ